MSGFPNSGTRRGSGGVDISPSVSTTATNVVPVPVAVGGGSSSLDQLSRILGLTATVAGQASSLASFERSQTQAEIDAFKHAERGAGVRDARFQALEISQKIKNGELAPGPGEDDAADWLRQLTDQQTEGQTEAYADAFASVFEPMTIASWRGRENELRNQARTVMSQDFTDALTAAGNPAAAGEIMEAAAITLDVPRTEVEQTVGVAALRYLANAGETEMFEAVAESMDSKMSEIPALRARLEATEEEKRRNDYDDVREAVYGTLNNPDVSNSVARELIADSDLSEKDKYSLLAVVDSRESTDLREVQRQNANNLRNSSYFKTAPADEIMSEVRRRIELDPNDPEYLDAIEAETIVTRANRDAQNDETKARVAASYSDPKGSPYTPVPGDSAKVAEVWREQGVIDGGGNVLDLRRLQTFVATGNGFVPNEIVQRWSRQAGSPNREDVIAAMTPIVAIHQMDPAWGLEIVEQLSGPARTRALAAIDELQLDPGASAVADVGAKPQLEANIDRLLSITGPSLDISRDESLRAVMFSNPNSKATAAELGDRVAESFTKQIRNTTFWKSHGKSRWWVQGLWYGDSREINPPSNVLAYYEDRVARSYRELLGTPEFQRDPEGASKRAIERATELTLTEFPVLDWGYKMRFGRRGQPETPGIRPGTLLYEDLKSSSLSADAVSDLWNNYVPQWDREQGGYTFWNSEGQYIHAGQVLVVNPLEQRDSEGPSVAEKIRRKWELKRATEEFVKIRDAALDQQLQQAVSAGNTAEASRIRSSQRQLSQIRLKEYRDSLAR